MKTIIGMSILTLVLALSITSCGKPNSTQPTPPAQAPAAIVKRALVSQVEISKDVEHLLKSQGVRTEVNCMQVVDHQTAGKKTTRYLEIIAGACPANGVASSAHVKKLFEIVGNKVMDGAVEVGSIEAAPKPAKYYMVQEFFTGKFSELNRIAINTDANHAVADVQTTHYRSTQEAALADRKHEGAQPEKLVKTGNPPPKAANDDPLKQLQAEALKAFQEADASYNAAVTTYNAADAKFKDAAAKYNAMGKDKPQSAELMGKVQEAQLNLTAATAAKAKAGQERARQLNAWQIFNPAESKKPGAPQK